MDLEALMGEGAFLVLLAALVLYGVGPVRVPRRRGVTFLPARRFLWLRGPFRRRR